MGSRCRLVGRGVLALGLIAGAGGVVAQPVSGQGQPLRAALMQGQDSRDGAILRVSDAPDTAGETLAGQGAVVSSVAGILSGRIAGSILACKRINFFEPEYIHETPLLFFGGRRRTAITVLARMLQSTINDFAPVAVWDRYGFASSAT